MSSKRHILLDIALLAATQVAVFYGAKYLLQSLDPGHKKKEKAKVASKTAMERLGISGMDLNEHEEIIAGEIVWPEEIKVSFSDIGGLDTILESLKETVIYPLIYPELFESVSTILGPPKGVLLHGPPGCGKTMTAKALAKESGATFINLHVSTMTDKWFGESQKLVNALFSLAKKLQPTIIFIDEIDSFLRERRSNDHEATSMMKAEFMTLWDGLNSTERTRIIILGATNRPNDIDKAILRRMPKRFAISLPDRLQRQKVLELLLKKIHLEPAFDLELLSILTEGYSNSDLKELCRNAVMVSVRDGIREMRQGSRHSLSSSYPQSLDSTTTTTSMADIDIKSLKVRRVTLDDFKLYIENEIQDVSGTTLFPVD